MKLCGLLFILISFVPYLKSEQCPPQKGVDTEFRTCNETCCDTYEDLGIIKKGQVVQYITSKSGKRLQRIKYSFAKEIPKHDATVHIDHDRLYQKIEGFGGALTDSVGYTLKSIKSPVLRNKILEFYFEVIGYEFIRIPIGGTDFSARPYTLDDFPDDYSLSRFSLQEEDYKYKIPFLRLIKKIKPNIKLLGTCWSPPAWMKTNNKLYGIGFVKPDFLNILVDYYVKFLDAYKSHGIEYWGLTTGNEPTIPFVASNTPLNSHCWTFDGQRTFIGDYFGPVIKNKYPNIKILANDDQMYMLPYCHQLMNDSKVYNYTDGIAVHWYFNDYFPASALTEFHNAFPDKLILATEASIMARPSFGNWENARKYLKDIMADLQNYATGWIDWNLCLNEIGGPTYIANFLDAPIIINAEKQEFIIQPMFHVLGQYSKFLVPGSIRIASSCNIFKLSVVAFDRPDGITAVVIFNDAKEDYKIRIKDNVKGSFVVNLEKESLTTVLY